MCVIRGAKDFCQAFARPPLDPVEAAMDVAHVPQWFGKTADHAGSDSDGVLRLSGSPLPIIGMGNVHHDVSVTAPTSPSPSATSCTPVLPPAAAGQRRLSRSRGRRRSGDEKTSWCGPHITADWIANIDGKVDVVDIRPTKSPTCHQAHDTPLLSHWQ